MIELGDALNRVHSLVNVLSGMVQKDPEQEVQGMAVPVLDAVLGAAKEWLPQDPVVDQIRDVVSVENIENGEPVRAFDALIVAKQIYAALEHVYDQTPHGAGPTMVSLEPGPFDDF